MRWRGSLLLAVCGLASGCLVSFDGYKGGLEAGGNGNVGAGADGATGGTATGGKASGGKSSGGANAGDAGEPAGGDASGGTGGAGPQAGSAGEAQAGKTNGGSAGKAGSGGGGTGGIEPTSCPTNLEGPSLVEVPTTGGGFYCMDRTEVPNEDYAVFLAANPSTANQGAACSWNNAYLPDTADCPSSATGAYDPVARPRVPVSCVDWCDARAYCAWAGKRLCGKIDGGTNPPASYIDADSSQWYRACSKAGTQKFPYGDTYQSTYCNGVDSPLIHPGNVATAANCEGGYVGLVDLSGNVAEWEDSCSANAAASDNCLIRGGSLQNAQTVAPSLLCNSSAINDATPSSVAATRSTQDEYIGFRCCYDP